MECYEGAKMIKTFRGQIADLGQDTIVLHTNDGSTGYRIKKFELFSIQPGVLDEAHVVQIFTVPQTDTSTYDNVEFSNQELLGAAYYKDDDQNYNPGFMTVTFDKMTFNQDIYITHADVKSNTRVNYYIELEQVKLDLGENTVATLKDIRNVKTQGF
jgi:hypothetical protein